MPTISPEKRAQCEDLIYRTFSAIDPTGANTEYYQKLFANMSDAQFTKLISGRLPFRYHVSPFNNEPKMPDIFNELINYNRKTMYSKSFGGKQNESMSDESIEYGGNKEEFDSDSN